MADTTAPKDSSGLAKSFEDRLTFPDKTNDQKKFNWADDEDDQPAQASTSDVSKAQTDGTADKENASVDAAQKDGANAYMGGSGLEEPLGEEYDVNVTLNDLQADPNNPLYSAKSFDDLDLPPKLREGIKLSNYTKPSKIQERALPLLLMNPAKNLIGQSQSGTGKTAAFNINMLVRVDLSTTKPQCLVLAPTRELAKQIANSAAVLGAMMEDDGLKIGEAIPSKENRNRQIEGQIIVGTPGTVIEAIKRRQLDTKNIKVLTLDEADNMLDMQGMGDQCKRVKREMPKSAQVVLFSATFPEQVLEFADSFAPNSNKITLQVEQLTVKGIKQMYLDCNDDEEKYKALLKFYSLMTISSSIIFVKRRDTATEIERRMTADGHKVAALSGALDGDARDQVFSRFRSGEAKVLITTNVLARGIDVQTVTMVINYDVPDLPGGQPDYETYLHRIGRTGRFGRTGAALTFVHNRKSWGQLMDICNHFGVEPTKLDTSDWDKVEKMLKAVMKNSRNVISKEVAMGD